MDELKEKIKENLMIVCDERMKTFKKEENRLNNYKADYFSNDIFKKLFVLDIFSIFTFLFLFFPLLIMMIGEGYTTTINCFLYSLLIALSGFFIINIGGMFDENITKSHINKKCSKVHDKIKSLEKDKKSIINYITPNSYQNEIVPLEIVEMLLNKIEHPETLNLLISMNKEKNITYEQLNFFIDNKETTQIIFNKKKTK